MKLKLLLSILLFVVVVMPSAAQAFSQSGIAVQGIARDENNSALKNQSISLKFDIYFLNSSNSEEILYTVTRSVTTDNFGVFSAVLNPDPGISTKIANNVTYLKITFNSVLISNDILRHVPYAISANNGVPTGAVMPFLGTQNQVPQGWALCDGRAYSSVSGSENLQRLLGGNALPDLRGLFLRGAGDDQRTETETVNLNTIQDDGIAEHNHAAGSLTANENGAHFHKFNFREDSSFTFNAGISGQTLAGSTYDQNYGTTVDGAHTHTVSGSSANAGGVETRPINYGVNYIIKL